MDKRDLDVSELDEEIYEDYSLGVTWRSTSMIQECSEEFEEREMSFPYIEESSRTSISMEAFERISSLEEFQFNLISGIADKNDISIEVSLKVDCFDQKSHELCWYKSVGFFPKLYFEGSLLLVRRSNTAAIIH